MNRIEVSADTPPDPRLARILDAAQDVFLANGFAYATMDGIAKAAKISKQTLYRHFRDKAHLFEAMVGREMEPFRHPPDLTRDDRAFEDVLFEIACWIYDSNTRRQTVAMVRTLIATAEQFEELVVRQEGLRFPTSVSWIADYMKSLADRGLLAILNPVHATRRFAHLAMQGSRYYMGYEVPSDAMREYFAWQTVRLFVGGLRGGSERLPGGRIS